MKSHHVIKNILFDVDGTLLDSKKDIANAQLHTLHQFGIDSFKAEDLYPLIGRSLFEIFSVLLPPYLHDRIPDAGIIYRTHYRAHVFDHTTLFPGVHETIQRLHQQGINLATATTKSTETTERVLKHFGIAEYFCHILGTDNTPLKPDPYLIDTVVNQQGWKYDETLMVGDTDKDIALGKNAGVLTCAVSYGSWGRYQLVPMKPDWIIDSIVELPVIVSSNSNGTQHSVSLST
jgi:phosphoglycolate phosphatase